MIQQRLLVALAVPFLAWPGFLQYPGFANLKHDPTGKGSESSLRILQNHAGIQQQQPSSRYHANFLLSLSPEQVEVEPFQPGCQEADQLCAVWSEFRITHPYPTQRVAAKRISNDEMIVVISEPPNSLSKSQWQAIIKSIFSTDLLEYRTFKWMIGIDGWVEDVVLRVKKPDVSQEDLLSHPLTRDRIALLNIAMFGSSTGTSIEPIEPAQSNETIAKIPNLRLSAGEVLAWVASQDMTWQTLNTPSYNANHWLAQSSVGTRQVQTSADRTLVLLTFPISDVFTARRTGSLPESLRIAFREFAVSSDILLGGAWSTDQVAILARARQVPTKDFPPLRLETFELIATQKTTELYQSYERNNLFAGKLATGEYALRDWAPILLSPALINTEFGALLNITDQMLKSWSEAGQVDYIYFDYPYKPNIFPFNGTPLSEVIRRQTGSQQVLFNWNTTGLGSVISGNPSILIPTQTGALPITYGSELDQGGELQTGHLQQYEQEAYNYFANLQDPNLATVVQYTLLYQLLLAAAPIEAEVLPSQQSSGSQVLTEHALDFIREVDAATGDDLANAKELVSAFREAHPAVNNQQLAALLADPRANQTQSAQINEYNSLVAEFNAKQESLQHSIDQYNAEVTRLNAQGGGSPGDRSRMSQRLASLEINEQELKTFQQRLNELSTSINQAMTAFKTLISSVQQLTTRLREFIDPANLDRVRTAFSNAHSPAPDSWIKTPATVLSWRNEGGRISLSSVGGHNLDSRALRFEESSSINSLRVVETDSGRVLQYPPSQRDRILANASDIARAVEHDGITDPQTLLQRAQRPVESRSRREALDIGASARPVSAPGRDAVLVGELQDLVTMNGCCYTYVATGEDGLRYSGTTNFLPPPPAQITAFGDLPSLYRYIDKQLKPSGSNSPVVFRGSREQVEAMVRSLTSEINRINGGRPPTAMERLTALADLINLPTYRVSSPSDSITVLGYGRNNSLNSLQINVGAEAGSSSPVSRVIARLSAVFKPNTARVQEVTSPALELQLPSRWQEAANRGELATIKLSYTEQGPIVTSNDVYISSITRESAQVPMVRAEMATATNDVIASKGTQEAVTFDTLIDIREQIGLQLGNLPIEQVEMILKKEQDTYYITNHSQRDSGS